MKKNDFKKPELSSADLSRSLFEVSQKLQQANNELVHQEKERTQFYANISHDLRAPITAISNSIEYLQSLEEVSKEDLDSTLNIMAKRTKYLTTLINDIFLLSSLESSTEKVHKEPVNMCFFLEDYFYMCEADPYFKDCDLHLKISDVIRELDPIVMLDPHLMQRALDNMMTNSVKYCTKRPNITMGVFLAAEGYVALYIEDNGIGVPKSELDKMFERSYRVDTSRTPNEDNSSGFGLAIVKSIVEHHNGRICCESTVGNGTVVMAVFKITDVKNNPEAK